jgi:hypothetical protein
MHLLVLHHLLELLAGGDVLRLQHLVLLLELLLHLLDLAHGVFDLLDTDIEMLLLLLQIFALGAEDFDKLVDELNVVARRDESSNAVCLACLAGERTRRLTRQIEG